MNVPKTGLAARMREWMQSQKRPFTFSQVCDGLDIRESSERTKTRNAMPDFFKRGEIERIGRGKYRYAHDWRSRRKSALRTKILRAMYNYIKDFSASDVQRISGVPDRCYVNKIMRELRDAGYIRKIRKRRCIGGVEWLHNIVNRHRFRIEVM